MDILLTIGLVILAIIIVIGIIRVITMPYTGFVNFLMELMLLDWLGDALEVIVDIVSDIWDD